MSRTSSDRSILEQWLVPKQDGMTCQSHTRLLVMFGVYNIVSILISVLLAHPVIYRPTKRATDRLYVLAAESWRRLRRKPLSTDDTTPDNKNSNNTTSTNNKNGQSSDDPQPSYNTIAFFLSIFGSLFLTIIGPIAVGLSLRYNHGHTVSIWRLIQQWSTRPRATFFIAIAHSNLASRFKKAGLEGQNNYRLPILCAFLSELLLNCFSMPYLVKQHNIKLKNAYGSYFKPGTVMQRGVDMALIVTSMQIGMAGMFTIVPTLILIRFKRQGRALYGYDGKENRWETQPKGRVSVGDLKWLNAWLFIPLIIPSMLVFIANWLLWAGFLASTTKDMYCLEGSLYIDLIYCLLPVVLGLWRLICGTRS